MWLSGWVALCCMSGVYADVYTYIQLSDGTTLRGTSDSGVSSFKGVRYAEPPIGKLRWAPPVLYSNKNTSEIVDATVFGTHCIQDNWPNGSEDCLFLNIYMSSENKFGDNLPVLIFIHGGSYVNGAAKFYPGGDMVSYWDSKAVVVTLDYRLNVFGFLGSDELRGQDPVQGSTGNYGLQDQRMGFEWVRRNIASFGGNPDQITIMGESAGGGSVSNHLTMEASWPYFQAAIIESGSFSYWTTQTMSRAESVYQSLLDKVGCDDLTCLINKSTDELFYAEIPTPDSHHYLTPYVPVADHVEMATHTWLAASHGHVNDVPILHGTNSDEGIMFTFGDGRRRVNKQELLDYWKNVKKYNDVSISKLLNLYVDGKDDKYPVSSHENITTTEWWALQRSTGDDMFSCPAKHLSSEISSKNHRKSAVYMYHFEYTALFSSYTIHSAEMPYVFHWPIGVTLNADLADIMSSYWANFIIDAKHDPNAMIIGVRDGLPEWPKYTFDGDELVVLDDLDKIHVVSGLKKEECDFFISLFDKELRSEFSDPSAADRNMFH